MGSPNSGEELQLGKYLVGQELGRGGFATVYAAKDVQLGRQVALKILHPILMTDPAFVQGFIADARAAASFHHPHIATIFEFGQEQGRLFIAQQLLPGGTLGARIAARGALPFEEAVRITRDIASALDEAHAAGLAHRDVKPANILFNARDQAVLTDFGLVRAIEQSVVARSSNGGMVGTPAYLAPEIWDGQPGGVAADIYALGCVLYEMLTGKTLFEGPTPPAVMRAHFAPRQFPKDWPSGVPTSVSTVLLRALDPQPENRFPSGGALANVLSHLLLPAQPPVRPLEPQSEPQAAFRVRVEDTNGSQPRRERLDPSEHNIKVKWDWTFIYLWATSSMIAYSLIFGMVHEIVRGSNVLVIPNVITLPISFGFIAIAIVGLSQPSILKQYIEVDGWWRFLASLTYMMCILAGFFGWTIGYFLFGQELYATTMTGTFIGAVLGMAKARLLQPYVSVLFSWSLVTSLIGGISAAIGYNFITIAEYLLLIGAAFGVVMGAIDGFALGWVLRTRGTSTRK